jgi:glycosyltransferase involved in cell wall biosynthesis
VVHLAQALARLDTGPEIIAYLDRPLPDSALAQELASTRVRIEVLRARRGWLRAALPWRLWRDGVHLVHLPSTILPPILPCPAVVTVHDLAWARYPETYAPADLHMQTRVVPRSVRRAARVIAVSRSTAHDLAETLGVRAERVAVIPLGVSSDFSPEGPGLAPDAFAGAERTRNGCILHTGGLHARKNVGRLLEAYARLRHTMVAPVLVIAGDASSSPGRVLQRKAESLSVADDVVFCGPLPDESLPALYRSASAVAYPSLYEGFGLPILEAMATGIPVVTSNRSSMAEVAGDAALLVDPESAEEIASALAQALTDDALRSRLSAQGLARAHEFTWERTARATVAVYEEVAGGGQGSIPVSGG